jgi:ABC-type branched-subunit amino acid transport system ATPase component
MDERMNGSARASRKSLLEVSSLCAGYGNIQIVTDLTMSVGEGEVVALVGPNGAGKSTALRAIVGVAKVFSGSVRLDGKEVTGSPLENLVRVGVGYIPQGDDTFGHMSVRDNLEMGGYLLRPAQRKEAMSKVLDRWPQLVPMLKRRASTLSGGQQKMAAVARAMMLQPRLLILDEPTAGLSEELTRVVIQEIGVGLAKSGTSILLVEQKATLALEAADWAYVIVQGAVAMTASAREVLADEGMAEVFLGGGARK